MTSWRIHLSLFVFLSTINLSKQGCENYFDLKTWGQNLTDTIPVIKTKHFKDKMECTVERECLNGRNVCHILYHCFNRTEEATKISDKCTGNASEHVPFYHFMCLTAQAFNHVPKGCEYEPACELYSEKAHADVSQTTTFSPPTPPTTATTATTTTAKLPERTTAALPQKTTATVTQSTDIASSDKKLQVKGEKDATPWVSIMCAVIFIILVVLLVCNRCRRRRDPCQRQDPCPSNDLSASYIASPGDQQTAESEPFLCDSISIHLARSGNDLSENETLH